MARREQKLEYNGFTSSGRDLFIRLRDVTLQTLSSLINAYARMS